MPRLILLVGPPGSGKSTICQALVDKIYINQDSQGKEGHFDRFLRAIAEHEDIVVDRMNFDKKQRARYIEPAKRMGYDVEIRVFHVPRALCLERTKARKDHPTIRDAETAWKAINFFFSRYERPTEDEGKILYEGEQNYLGDAIVCDLDGTLCNIDHRLHFVKNKPKNWKAFFENIPLDEPNKWCQNLVVTMRELQGYKLVFCSGRGEEYRKETEAWLSRHVHHWDALFMRPAGDSRPDDLIKEIILDFDILPNYNPLFFIDDRKRVVDMWRRRGFTCLQCAPGEF